MLWATDLLPVRQSVKSLLTRVVLLLAGAALLGLGVNTFSSSGIALAGRESFSIVSEATQVGLGQQRCQEPFMAFYGITGTSDS